MYYFDLNLINGWWYLMSFHVLICIHPLLWNYSSQKHIILFENWLIIFSLLNFNSSLCILMTYLLNICLHIFFFNLWFVPHFLEGTKFLRFSKSNLSFLPLELSFIHMNHMFLCLTFESVIYLQLILCMAWFCSCVCTVSLACTWMTVFASSKLSLQLYYKSLGHICVGLFLIFFYFFQVAWFLCLVTPFSKFFWSFCFLYLYVNVLESITGYNYQVTPLSFW